ncbi:GNAT family N-acetyltransferase [Marinimicrobium sp. ABcell2]|uniref:GNAT family N-acetyltransferase n=1 Tax=Marinimicrobium sp. ABcell2 TaxID=3069751 RepID=UPI0027B7B867|nr:GNAT family N-acetyltransferase [Marinimicrobium sp. ABcell2]MDQ2075422.1 GNAT family N-acetyltransferase [Marinimicrobium sp. ABcell2]
MGHPASYSIMPVEWTPHERSLTALRRTVFMLEQGVSEADEWDGLDDQAQHFLVISQQQAIGAARVVKHREQSIYHIGRVAVLAEYRGLGIGSALMNKVIRWSKKDALPENANIELNAQVDRLNFYRRLGFVEHGPTFLDAGIVHQAMFFQGEGAIL